MSTIYDADMTDDSVLDLDTWADCVTEYMRCTNGVKWHEHIYKKLQSDPDYVARGKREYRERKRMMTAAAGMPPSARGRIPART